MTFQSPNRYESDLSNEVVYILVGQEATKISEVKFGGQKKLPNQPGPGRMSRIWLSRQFLIDLQLWPLIFLQPLDLQGCTVPHLKDLIHICLEPEAQGCGMTFNRFYVGSKYPYFISYRGKWLYLFCQGCIPPGGSAGPFLCVKMTTNACFTFSTHIK